MVLRLLIVHCKIKHMLRIIVMALTVLLAASGCNSSQVTLEPPIADGKQTYKEFISETKTFPYTIADNRKRIIMEKYPRLNVGMTKKEIASIIGDPDFSTYLRAKAPPQKYLGSEWTYYFHKANPNLANEKLDKGLYLFFDPNDKLHWILPQNIEGLSEKGSPRQGSS